MRTLPLTYQSIFRTSVDKIQAHKLKLKQFGSGTKPV